MNAAGQIQRLSGNLGSGMNPKRRRLLQATGLALVGGLVTAGCTKQRAISAAELVTPMPTLSADAENQAVAMAPAAASTNTPEPARPVDVPRVAADPTNIPGPVDWTEPRHHQITLETVEVVAEIEPGVTFRYMTFGGQIPGPMIRVRQGDTVEFTLTSRATDFMPHNIDFHAVYGTGGGAEATYITPGQSNGLIFKAMFPGAFMYHCAVPNLDYHISSGMFGIIVVEPPEGLSPVTHEFYLGQHEVYTDKPAGTQGNHNFAFDTMLRENPTYVLLNGEKYALTAERHGAMQVKSGDTARIFFVCGGPNVTSNFHPIGNVWSKVYREGAILNNPERYVQTVAVPPGSCAILEMEFPLPQDVKLVDHAITRVLSKGMLGVIHVEGEPQPDIFNPDLPGDPTG